MSKGIIEIKVPSVGESVTEVEIGEWLKKTGEFVRKDETVAVLETDKATVEIPSPVDGTLTSLLRKQGERVAVGDVIAQLSAGDKVPALAAPPADPKTQATVPVESSPKQSPHVMPAAARLMTENKLDAQQVTPTGPAGRILKEDVLRALEKPAQVTPLPVAPPPAPVTPVVKTPEPPAGEKKSPAASAEAFEQRMPAVSFDRTEEEVPMTLMRRKIAERLVQAQHNAALLTTFNEIDMSAAMALRKEYQEKFQERYKIKLGFMSIFVKAVVEALKDCPALNAEIRGNNIVYHNYYDIGIAIGGGRGLVVPVLRNAERLSFAEVEQAIGAFAVKAKENKIRPEDLSGGTFTITNGGVYGSMLSTPLVNPPQSGVLGMHAIQDRPMAVNGQVVVRPVMFVALTYDHRIVDGREAVTFLKRVKEMVENPVRMLIEV